MLCTRPQEKNAFLSERPYCFRVTPPEDLGLCPPAKLKTGPTHKTKVNLILLAHKRWLQSFEDEIQTKKENILLNEFQELERTEKIKENAQKLRNDIRSGAYKGHHGVYIKKRSQ